MRLPALVHSFRARLLLLLALMLGLTLGVQYYFNLRAVRSNAHMVIEQEQEIMSAIALAIRGLRSNQYLDEIISKSGGNLVDRNGRVQNILVVDDSGNVRDSAIRDYGPRQPDDQTTQYFQIKDIPLPPLRRAIQSDETEQLPDWMPPQRNVDVGEAGAFYFPILTDKGRLFIIVQLGSSNTLTNVLERQATRLALYSLLLLLVTT
ncbi:MAG: hypothetical protein DMF69_22405, partial [Acidobacteria bacterium]